MTKELVVNKQYWFKECNHVYSALFEGKIDDWGMPIVRTAGGNEWMIPAEHLHDTAKEAIDDEDCYVVVH